MEKDIIKTITLKPIKAIRESKNNPYMRGLVMKRNLTTREACHIYRNIFLFNIDLILNDYDCDGTDGVEEKKEYYKDITDTMNDYIKGNADWSRLCDETYCYDDDETGGVSIAAHLKLLEYLQKKRSNIKLKI